MDCSALTIEAIDKEQAVQDDSASTMPNWTKILDDGYLVYTHSMLNIIEEINKAGIAGIQHAAPDKIEEINTNLDRYMRDEDDCWPFTSCKDGRDEMSATHQSWQKRDAGPDIPGLDGNSKARRCFRIQYNSYEHLTDPDIRAVDRMQSLRVIETINHRHNETVLRADQLESIFTEKRRAYAELGLKAPVNVLWQAMPDSKIKKLDRIVGLGLGRLAYQNDESEADQAIEQHAVLLELFERLNKAQNLTFGCSIQDPAYSDETISFMRERGVRVFSDPSGIRVIERGTLVIMNSPGFPAFQVIFDICHMSDEGYVPWGFICEVPATGLDENAVAHVWNTKPQAERKAKKAELKEVSNNLHSAKTVGILKKYYKAPVEIDNLFGDGKKIWFIRRKKQVTNRSKKA